MRPLRLLTAMLACVALLGLPGLCRAAQAAPKAARVKAQVPAKKQVAPKPRPQPAPKAAVPEADLGLIDWAQQPFSDHASHYGLQWEPGAGMNAWRVLSFMAFGSQAASWHEAKRLFDMRLVLEVEGESEPRLGASAPVALKSHPRWAVEEGEEGLLQAQSTLLYPRQDVIVAALNLSNKNRSTLRFRPVLVLTRKLTGMDAEAQLGKDGSLSLTLDRSRLAQRPLKESVVLRFGAAKLSASFGSAGATKPLLAGVRQATQDSFELRLRGETLIVLKAGQTTRLPWLLSLDPDVARATKAANAEWKQSALPRGTAFQKARTRWALSAQRLPQPVDARWQRLTRQSALTLLLSEYGRRGELTGPMFSAAKGQRDAFSSVEGPLIALGWSDLDHGAAEQSLLQLCSFAAAAPAPAPPSTGEELLPWEAGGLPLHGWAAWELYHRDPEAARANSFLLGLAPRLAKQGAWWKEARDGDGNGLYAFARTEEKPWDPRALSTSPQPVLQTWSLALSALLAWEGQAAAAVAQDSGQSAEAQRLMDQSAKTLAAIEREAWDPASGRYAQGLDALWMLELGLVQDPARARDLVAAWVTKAAEGTQPFAEDGTWQPWKAYLGLRVLAAYGQADLAQEAAQRVLAQLDQRATLFSAWDAAGNSLGASGDAGTASVALQIALQRYEQNAYILPETRAVTGRCIQVRSLDGAIYMKRLRLPVKKGPYATLALASAQGGAILKEGAFIMSTDQAAVWSLTSTKGLDIVDMRSPKQPIFSGTKRADMILKPGTRYLVKIAQ